MPTAIVRKVVQLQEHPYTYRKDFVVVKKVGQDWHRVSTPKAARAEAEADLAKM